MGDRRSTSRAPALNKAEVDELCVLFDKYDDDGSGTLELDEFAKMMSNLG